MNYTQKNDISKINSFNIEYKEYLYGYQTDLYKVFCEVANCKSFSKAAKNLYMTQPAVSQAIMSLEKELGVRLLPELQRGRLDKRGTIVV